jgi:guanylate kinase
LPFRFVVTATTRPPRPDEEYGVDYFFHSKAKFAEMIERGELMEYALVYDDYKGIPKEQVRQALASGVDVVMRLDVQGAATVRRLSSEALLIFLTASSQSEMVRRLEARMTESPEALKLRIATARQEMQRMGEFDYAVINAENRLDETVDTILAIIKAEHCRVHHRKVTL